MLMARSKKTRKAQTTAQTAVQCAGCDRTCTTATGLWYCPPCTTMYWDGVNAGHACALAAQPPLPPPSPAVAAVVNAVVIPAKKAGRKRTPFCCHISGCKQAEKEHDFKSSFHLKAHNKAAHETPRFGPCSRCGNMFKSYRGLQSHQQKQLDCADREFILPTPRLAAITHAPPDAAQAAEEEAVY
jgi:hypothetical protein